MTTSDTVVAGSGNLDPIGVVLTAGSTLPLVTGLGQGDIDVLMGERTRRRPVTAGRVAPAHAQAYDVEDRERLRNLSRALTGAP